LTALSELVRAFIQARMSSSRFPGKVLAPFRGRPIKAHVIAGVAQAMPIDRIVIATSRDTSDDPLASYARDLGIAVYRGPLDDVFSRFQECLETFPCEWFFRVCADSPLYDGALLSTVSKRSANRDVDIFTNVYPRTFPKGHSVEMINSATFAGIKTDRLSSEEREHVTKFFYARPSEFRIVNMESSEPSQPEINLCIDSIEDLHRLENLAAGTTVATPVEFR
jgi:spore coat polysaccharide biosynthesis protein SpsF (cytidylyltransferase family)